MISKAESIVSAAENVPRSLASLGCHNQTGGQKRCVETLNRGWNLLTLSFHII